MMIPYDILQGELSFQEEIKKSRFITYLAHVQGKQKALDYLQLIKSKHKEARHHCWAYIAAGPQAWSDMGCSDDGEPKGTAGKPMLNVLQGFNVGEIIAVVVRYSGGIKLGTGGLVRAYSNGIQQLSTQIQTIEKRFFVQYQIHCDYAQMANIENMLSNLSAKVINIDYLQSVSAIIEVDVQYAQMFVDQLIALTQGKVMPIKITPQSIAAN